MMKKRTVPSQNLCSDVQRCFCALLLSAIVFLLLSVQVPQTAQADEAETSVPAAVIKAGWVQLDGSWFHYNKSGETSTGWLKSGKKWYYLNPSDGKMLTGRHNIDGATYFLTETGAMKTGWNAEEAGWFYYHKSGALKSGWIKSGSRWYYLDTTQNGLMKTGKFNDGKAWYITNTSGAMESNKWVALDQDWYFANKSGALLSGWKKSGSRWYWLSPELAGRMVSNSIETIEGTLYSFDEKGVMRSNCQVALEGNACGYAAKSGAIEKIGTFEEGRVVLRDAEGNILTGWQSFAGRRFYGEPETGIMHIGPLEIDGKAYDFQIDGALNEHPFANPNASARLVDAAWRTPFQGNGYCAKWANYVYTNAGFKHPDGHAKDLFWKYCNISDLSKIEPGMIIAVPSHTRSAAGRRYGHVAIYLGNGMVGHNREKMITEPLVDWLAYYQTTYAAKCGWAFPAK